MSGIFGFIENILKGKAEKEAIQTLEDLKWDTLPDLISRAFPSAQIRAPNVLVIGAQSSGKTKAIVSMLFHYIIAHPHFTDEMGMNILKLFKTGESMVTRRPTTVGFINTLDETVCNVRLQFGDRIALFGTPEFTELIESATSYGPDDIFEKEITITIIASGVPNIQFTDFPGLTTTTKVFRDTGRTVKQLIKEKLRDTSSTLVVVEDCLHTEFSTSHIIPLIK